MKWCIPSRRDEALPTKADRYACVDAASADFNVPLPENGGSVCIADDFEANEDIRTGQLKTFSNVDEMLNSLKKPW